MLSVLQPGPGAHDGRSFVRYRQSRSTDYLREKFNFLVNVQDLTKTYGTQDAVKNASFVARPGEILAFLGPNGAGKTTTMKVITCYLPPTSGTVTVDGYDVRTEPLKVRERIGYLPEHNPLYKDMYVREYLGFVAGLQRVKKPKERIDRMIEMTGLEREQHKLIGSLSKGYRQRVGLAQAMLHDPQVLILDEPLSGLDPNQRAEIREVIRDIGRQRTLIFSSHVMQEVQQLCHRVLIMDRGRIVANDPIEQLRERVTVQATITVEFAEPVKPALLKQIDGVTGVQQQGARYFLSVPADRDLRAEVFRFAVDHKLTLLSLGQTERSVEEVFRELTRKS